MKREKATKVSDLDLETLDLSVREHVKPSYLAALKRCVQAELVWFTNEGRGAPVLTDKGKLALQSFRTREP